MVVDGAVVRLAHQSIGDPGHVLVLPDGPECSAGCHGCAEALVSAPAIVERACRILASKPRSLLPGPPYRPSAKEIIEAGRLGDAVATKILCETGQWLGMAIASLAAIFCPDRVVIAGGVAEADGMLLEPAEARFSSQTGQQYHTASSFARRAWAGKQAWSVPRVPCGWPDKKSHTGRSSWQAQAATHFLMLPISAARRTGSGWHISVAMAAPEKGRTCLNAR